VAARPRTSEFLLGLIQGPAELLPVSSSGHVAAARALWGLEGDEVALHAGSLAALVLGCREEAYEILRRLTWRRVGMHLLAGGIPAAAGYVLERRRVRPPVVPGLLAGAALLFVTEGAEGKRSRWAAGPADGAWLGFAQAAALWPGVSRNGATLAAARWRGFAPSEANLLSREVGVPVTLGAVALRLASAESDARTSFCALAASFVSAWASLPLLRIVDRGGPLWPFAAERAGLALLLLRESRS
jgi:undecaprenyl-diphosphatase